MGLKRVVCISLLIFLLVCHLSISFAAEKAFSDPIVEPNQTVQQIADNNGLDVKLILKSLKLADTPANRTSTLEALGIEKDKAYQAIRKALVIRAEEKSKDWRLIVTKFVLWWSVVLAGIWMLNRNKVTAVVRKWAVFGAFIIFGVILGSDPSPMGTVKDTIALAGAEGTFFPPRIIAFIVFSLMVIVGNKMICGWGCQFGTLQDWLYQISPIKHKIKIPFAITGKVRIAVFIVFSAIAIIVPFDIIGAVDPFKIFSPAVLTIVSGGFIILLLVLSLVTYRPWCTFACPFGLTGWFFEKYAWFKVRWNKNRCVDCGICKKVCPSQHTVGLLEGAARPADCYSCGLCISQCPVHALTYSREAVSNTVILGNQTIKKS